MNLQTIQKRIQEVLKSKDLSEKGSKGMKSAKKKSKSKHRQATQPTQGSQGPKHKFKPQEVMQLTDKLVL